MSTVSPCWHCQLQSWSPCCPTLFTATRQHITAFPSPVPGHRQPVHVFVPSHLPVEGEEMDCRWIPKHQAGKQPAYKHAVNEPYYARFSHTGILALWIFKLSWGGVTKQCWVSGGAEEKYHSEMKAEPTATVSWFSWHFLVIWKEFNTIAYCGVLGLVWTLFCRIIWPSEFGQRSSISLISEQP